VRSLQTELQPPLVSSQDYGWQNIVAEEFHQVPGEEAYHSATEAKHLLKTTHFSVMDIALLCGFSSHSHLGKWFRKYTGTTPKAFRT
jgi:methylphosphotriester-DNA--protein-cysteine methyltransferase